MVARSTLAIRLFGRLDVAADDVPIRIAGRHAQALMALLALQPRPRLRDALAADLWPEAGTPSGASLRQALWQLRSCLAAAGVDPDRWIEADQDVVGIRTDVRIALDVDEFERLAASPDGDDRERALRIHDGDLLEGLAHECFVTDRERLSDRYEDLLADISGQRLERGDIRGAQRAATELLARDPLREEAHAVLIEAYGRTGTRSQVVRQYRRACAILRAELAVAPLPETVAIYRWAMTAVTTRSADRAIGRVSEAAFEGRTFVPALVTSA